MKTEIEMGSERHATALRAAAWPPHSRIVVLANREPYAHEFGADGSVVVQRPASGLVTGLEPMLRSSGGTWIAHASGSADREHADGNGRVPVPPEAPEYTLRRLWIDEERYERYYSGLANEALWPLCHIAYVRPEFRARDWAAYREVNETFARAALEETSADGLLLIQDYHLGLVPELVRARAPRVASSLFWHIPWPNAEIAGIFPWIETLLAGMSGADVVGFHTPDYCRNFLETAERHLDCRVDFDEMSIMHASHRTLVRPYPISVEWPYPSASRREGRALRRELGIGAGVHVSVGVDRADYTKGLIERVAAIEQLLEDDRSLIGNYVLVQLASPTRTGIGRYQQFAAELNAAVDRVNQRLATDSWKPIVLRMRTFTPEEVRVHYAMADSALVTPLHDGMNLVAKEYVASCDREDGVLVLSAFAGAAKELHGALLVNPFDTQQIADAIRRAVRMPRAERRARMRAMREQIAANSIDDWAESILSDLRDVRQQDGPFWQEVAAG